MDYVIELLRDELRNNLNNEHTLDLVYAIKILETKKAYDEMNK